MQDVSELWKKVLARIRFTCSQRLDHRFDRHFGFELMEELLPKELHPDDEAAMQSARYQPTSSLAFRGMMRAVDVRHEDFVFLDVGSGKGEALMLASMYPFKSIIGVELSRRLHEIAEAHLASFLERRGTRTYSSFGVRMRPSSTDLPVICSSFSSIRSNGRNSRPCSRVSLVRRASRHAVLSCSPAILGLRCARAP